MGNLHHVFDYISQCLEVLLLGRFSDLIHIKMRARNREFACAIRTSGTAPRMPTQSITVINFSSLALLTMMFP